MRRSGVGWPAPRGLAAIGRDLVPTAADERLEDGALTGRLGEVVGLDRPPTLLVDEQLEGARRRHVHDDRLADLQLLLHLLFSFCFDVLLERLERLRPVPVEVVAQRGQRIGLELVEAPRPLGASAHQPGIAEDTQVHRHGRPPDRQRGGQLSYRSGAACQLADDLASRAVA